MGTFVIEDCEIYLNEHDVTADVTSVTPSIMRDEVDATTMASNGYKEFKAGLASSQAALATYYDGDLIESAIRPLEGVSGSVLTATFDDQFGSAALFGSGMVLSVDRGFQIGDMAKLDSQVRLSGREGLIYGHLLVPKATKTATGNGTGSQLGAVTAAQKVWAAAHVFSVAGTATPTLTLKVQSDDNSGFTSATDRITFTDFTAAGVEYKSLAGAVTDDYWRVSWTISGTSPQFSVAVVVGIQ